MSKPRFFVVSKENLARVLAGQGAEQYIKFDYVSQAKTWKAGMEINHPETKYCIVREMPVKFEQISGFTGEEEITYDYT